jgi:hypothetical protein
MKTKAILLNLVLLLATLSACGGQANQNQAGQTCPDLTKVVEAFYAANDASQFATSSQYLTDDVVLVEWAQGANGYHMGSFFAIGKGQIQSFLSQPGLKRKADQANLPNYAMQDVQLSGLKVSFMLVPDRLDPNNRPVNPYQVEAFFSGCQIEVLKVVERVTWL